MMDTYKQQNPLFIRCRKINSLAGRGYEACEGFSFQMVGNFKLKQLLINISLKTNFSNCISYSAVVQCNWK